MKHLFAAIVIVAAGTSAPTWAGSMNLERVPASARWIAHIDAEQWRAGEIGQLMTSKLEASPMWRKMDTFATMANVDPRKDVTSITLYGSDNEENQAVMLMNGTFDTDALLRLAEENDTYLDENSPYGVVHSWIDARRMRSGRRTYGTIFSDGTVAMSSSKERLLESMALAAGYGDDIADAGTFGPSSDFGVNTFILAMADLESLDRLRTKADMLKAAKAIRVAMGETGGSIVGNVIITAEDSDSAAQIQDMARGLVAFGTMTADRRPVMAEMAKGTTISTHGNIVSIVMECATESVIDIMQERMAEWEKKRAKRDSRSEASIR